MDTEGGLKPPAVVVLQAPWLVMVTATNSFSCQASATPSGPLQVKVRQSTYGFSPGAPFGVILHYRIRDPETESGKWKMHFGLMFSEEMVEFRATSRRETGENKCFPAKSKPYMRGKNFPLMYRFDFPLFLRRVRRFLLSGCIKREKYYAGDHTLAENIVPKSIFLESRPPIL